MQPVIYDVAVSIDGFIAGPASDISQFAASGPVVDAYLARLQTYAVALMGRETYQFGYRFGLEPGRNPYPHMRCVVVSTKLELPPDSDVEAWTTCDADALRRLREQAGGPIYLCGGGRLAAHLLALDQIDRIRLKRAPAVLGGGTPLFDPRSSEGAPTLRLEAQEAFPDGYLYQDYVVVR